MYVHITNENYGLSVATHDEWVIVGNPNSFRYDPESASLWRTGSVDVYKYNPVSDQHDLIITLYRGLNGPDKILLAEDPSGSLIHTDIVKTYILPYYSSAGIHWIAFNLQNIPIEIDSSVYISTLEDDYGHSIDVYNNVLAVGDRWFIQKNTIEGIETYSTGSSVDIFNLSELNTSFFDGLISTGSAFLADVITPPSGEQVSGSFGYSVSINNEWLAVGSPLNNGTGSVHLYRRTIPADVNNIKFTFYQTITGSNAKEGDLFGHSIDINKQTGSYSSSLVIGCGRTTTTSSFVYYFEFDGSNWKEKATFAADRSIRNLPFYNVNPILTSSYYTADGYGNAVALFENDIAVGAPTDRIFWEYSGSTSYKQGSAYLYHRCDNTTQKWYLVKKTYGNEKTLKNNKLGFCLSLWDNYFALGVPKFNMDNLSSCYIQGSLWQSNYCNADSQNYIQGQWILFEKNTSSVDIDWDIVNVYQKKKRFLQPYRAFSYDIDISNKSVVVGAPLLFSNSSRYIDIFNTGSVNGDDIISLDDLSGKAYIYNLKNLREEFHVGNVFYRNGKIVLNTSGSLFDGLWFNPLSEDQYEYELHFSSKQTLHEKQIACVVEPGEFNTSQNPTALIKEKAVFDINNNGKFDSQDVDVILQYMQLINTKYNQFGPITDWSSSLLTTDDEKSYYNFYHNNSSYYNTNADYLSQSFFNILHNIGISTLDFNQDSKVDLNDMNIFWKYCSNRLTQLNYQSYITPNSKRKLFSDIVDHLNEYTKKSEPFTIKPDFITYHSKSMADKTGSYLAPYVTTIGLYNGLDLVAVAKLGSPIKLTGNFPINFMVKIDF